MRLVFNKILFKKKRQKKKSVKMEFLQFFYPEMETCIVNENNLIEILQERYLIIPNMHFSDNN